MKNSILYKIILSLLISVVFLSASYGQIQEAPCGTPSTGGTSAPYVPTSGTYKIFIIMVVNFQMILMITLPRRVTGLQAM